MRPVTIVTGAAGGMGGAIVRRLLADNYRVAMADRDGSALQRIASVLHQAGQGEVDAHVVDLACATDLDKLAAAYGEVSALINNAGIFDERAFLETDSHDFRRMVDINLIAVAELTRRIVPVMKRGSKIVNIASRAYLGARNHVHYVASKAALVGYTRAAAMELAPQGILVNAVAPGLIDTPMLRALSPDRLQAQLSLQPTGRAGRPEDVANAVSFLASPHMDFITGQVLVVDGGKSLGGSVG